MRKQDPPAALLAALVVLLVTLTLRAPVTAVAPVVPAIGADLHLGASTLSLLTSLPLVCFILVAPVVPILLGRWGTWRLVALALLAATCGTVLRSIGGTAWLALGTLVLGCAVAVASVLAPAVVRQLRPSARGGLTAIYTAGLSLGPAVATGLTVPAAQLLGDSWQLALASWAVLPLAALGLWALTGASGHLLDDDASSGSVTTTTLLREASAWGVTAYLGLSSLLFYTSVAWLPAILQDAGRSPGEAGATAMLANVIAVPAALAVPFLARRSWAARWVAALAPTAVAGALLLVAFLDGTGVTLAAMTLLGLGQGASVAMAYTIIVATARSSRHAAALSSMSQTVGVTLAATGPLALGASHDALGQWSPGLLVAALVGAVQAVVGAFVARGVGHRAHGARLADRSIDTTDAGDQ